MDKFTFPTQFSNPPCEPTCPGDRYYPTYIAKYDENGTLYLEETGKEDIYAEIQSHADSCDIKTILARYELGDESALSKIQGAYGDFVGMPRTYAEMLNRVNEAEDFFMSLPVDTREKFNHNFAEFMTSMDKPDFFSRLQPAVADQAVTPVAEDQKGDAE